jgi:hypothetical protein
MNNQNKIYGVFISSTYDDLKKERAIIYETTIGNGCLPIGMEAFPASDDAPLDYIKKMIDLADYYVLILAGRYGSIDKESGKSFTELEYEYALAKKKPILAFLHNNWNILEDKKKKKRLRYKTA